MQAILVLCPVKTTFHDKLHALYYVKHLDSDLAFCRPLLKEIMLEYSSSSDKEEAEERWDDIGIQLEIDDEKLGEIRTFTARDDQRREAFKHMIRAWMKQEKPQPTWLNFVEALEHLDACKNLSAHLRLKYCKLTYMYSN